jgi:hypothetical protein
MSCFGTGIELLWSCSFPHVVRTMPLLRRRFHFLDSERFLWRCSWVPWQFRLLTNGFFEKKLEAVMLRVPEYVRKTHSVDGAVALDIRRGQMFSLNVVGSKMLQWLDEGFDPEEIAQKISSVYGISAEIARSDVREFIALLEKYHLVAARVTEGQL